jgi:hypothetical protein
VTLRLALCLTPRRAALSPWVSFKTFGLSDDCSSVGGVFHRVREHFHSRTLAPTHLFLYGIPFNLALNSSTTLGLSTTVGTIPEPTLVFKNAFTCVRVLCVLHIAPDAPFVLAFRLSRFLSPDDFEQHVQGI